MRKDLPEYVTLSGLFLIFTGICLIIMRGTFDPKGYRILIFWEGTIIGIAMYSIGLLAFIIGMRKWHWSTTSSQTT